MTGVAFVDGEQVAWPGPARIDDPAMAPGLGLFETMRGRGGDIPLVSRHIARLITSATALGLRCPPAERLERFLRRTVSAIGGGDHRVRLMLSDAGQVVIQASPLEIDRTPVRLATVTGPVQAEGFAKHKTTAYLPYVQVNVFNPNGYRLDATRLSYNVQVGDNAAVFGAGGVGLSTIQALRIKAANHIIAVDTVASKGELALELGATHFINAAEVDAVKAIRELLPFTEEMPEGPFGAGGVNWSFECVGHPALPR